MLSFSFLSEKRLIRIGIDFGQFIDISTSESPCLDKDPGEFEDLRMFRWIILMIFYLKKKCCFPRCTNDYVTKKYPCYAQGRGNASDLCSEGDLDGIWRTMRKLITQGKQKVVIKT